MYNDIQKINIDLYLKELAKEFKRLTKKQIKAEIIIVGGASIIINYDFRNTSLDIDAFNTSESIMKEAAKSVAKKFNLSQNWLNSDFASTASYSNRLRQYSQHYKTFCNVLDVRTIKREYLIAMKMVSARRYKNDLSDIIGILYFHYKNDDVISFEEIETAVLNLYGDWNKIRDYTKAFVQMAIENKSFIGGYENQLAEEGIIKEELLSFDEKYENVLNADNVDDIISSLLD